MFNIDLKETAETIKKTAFKANTDAIKASDKIVDETLAASEEWQKVLAKALKASTTILGQQQELGLTVIEGLKTQYLKGNKRFIKLFGLKNFTPEILAKDAKATIKKAKKTIATVEDQVEDLMEEVAVEAKKAYASVTKTATKAKTPKTKTVVKKAEKILSTSAKKVVTAPIKATKTTVATKKVVQKLDLKSINGIGPKMESVLNQNGILTFADLAKVNQVELEKTLVAINQRYAMYDVAAWIDSAKKMA